MLPILNILIIYEVFFFFPLITIRVKQDKRLRSGCGWQVLDGQENTLQVASAPKIHVSLPRGQGTLHSFLQSGGPIHRPCDGKSHSGTLTSGPDTGNKSSGLPSQHTPSPQEEGLLMNFGGVSNWKQMEESLKREFIDEYDELDISNEDKRRKLF